MVAALITITPRSASASTYRWQVDESGNWNEPVNWVVVEGPAGAGYPNLPGDVAVFDEPLTAARTVTIPDTVTIAIGRFTVALPAAPGKLTIVRAGTGQLVFDNLGEAAVIESTGSVGPAVLNLPIQLAGDLNVTGQFQFFGIGETGGVRNVTITGGDVSYRAENTYTGTTTVTDGRLVAFPDGPPVRMLGALVVGDGVGISASALVEIPGDTIDDSADVLVRADGYVGFGTGAGYTVDELNIENGGVGVGTPGINGTLTATVVNMQGGNVAVAPDRTLRLAGSLTATSTETETAEVGDSGSPPNPGAFTLLPGNHDFTIADGPRLIDFQSRFVTIGPAAPAAGLTKLGAGLMLILGTGNYTGATSIMAGELNIDGTVASSTFTVSANAALSGVGTVGPVNVAANGTLSPGPLPAVPPGGPVPTGATVGIMNTGSIAFAADARFKAEILSVQGGGAGYDRLNVAGTVDVGNAVLALSSVPVLPLDATFTIINNDGSDPVIGTFKGMPEGHIIELANGLRFALTYHGGNGNDVVLSNVTPVTYFLSEGATGTFFDEDVLIANPNTAPAPVTMTFFLPGGGTVVHPTTVPAQSRVTVRVDEIPGLEAASASVEVRSDNRLALAVERTMFWDSTHYGGHTANSVPRAEQQWLFAEGAQNDFFNTYLLLANPQGMVKVKVTFLRETEPPFVLEPILSGTSRTTIYAGAYPELVGRSFGIVVESPGPITAERAMYFATTPQRLWSGGHDNVGSPEASTSWFHPEGASGTFFSTFILMSNPQLSSTNVTLRFLLPDGAPIEVTRTIEAQQRLTINPADLGIAALQNASFSTVVTSNVPIVSERAMYWNTDDTVFGEGHASSGLTATALNWSLAEGRVGGPDAYTTYILLANPNSIATSVKVTYLRASGTPVVKTYDVAANSRFNIDVGGMVTELQNESFGALIEVQTAAAPIAVERSMYWNSEGRFWSGGTNAIGSVVPR
jgi:autotransporter-associated beta strand protein